MADRSLGGDTELTVYKTLTIADSDDTSDAVNLNGLQVVALVIDSAFDGTALTFTCSQDDVTYLPYHDINGLVSIDAVASSQLALAPPVFVGLGKYMKVVSDASQSGADCLIQVLVRVLR